MLYEFIRFFLFRLNPERAHYFSLLVMRSVCRFGVFKRLVRRWFEPPAMELREVFGLRFKNPIGLAAGFDKNAEHIDLLTDLGFGFIEVGSVTARPAKGNPQPRLFRLPRDRALINRMGLNNDGVDKTLARIQNCRRDVPIFVNIAKSPDPSIQGQCAIDDYVATIHRLKDQADVIVLNISCPNSGDGRTFEDPMWLEPLLDAVKKALGNDAKPWVVKVSPDLNDDALTTVVDLAVKRGVSGFTATNTTTCRERLETSTIRLDEIGPGGLSGAPLHERAVHVVRTIKGLTDLPVIGVGGIRSAVEARAFLDAGASLVQLYTGFIYGGPGTVKKICAKL